jgi:hypothetical protein
MLDAETKHPWAKEEVAAELISTAQDSRKACEPAEVMVSLASE